SCTRLSPKSVCPASTASRTFSAECVLVIATSSTSSADRPAFVALLAICSRTRSRFSAIEPIVEASLVYVPSGLSTIGAITHTHRMITKNIGMLLLAIYLIAVGILTLTGLGIGIISGVLALLAGIFILIGR